MEMTRGYDSIYWKKMPEQRVYCVQRMLGIQLQTAEVQKGENEK